MVAAGKLPLFRPTGSFLSWLSNFTRSRELGWVVLQLFEAEDAKSALGTTSRFGEGPSEAR